MNNPAYEGVYVSGQAQGVLGLVKRSGTGPSLYAPMVTDALATDLAAVRQRGAAVLGAGGAQATMGLSLPLLLAPGEPGLIEPGMLVEVMDPDDPWRGIARSLSVRFDGSTVQQSVQLERHLA